MRKHGINLGGSVTERGGCMVQGRGPDWDYAAGRKILLLRAVATTHTSTAMNASPVLGIEIRPPACSICPRPVPSSTRPPALE
jgi:hypothetical protein